MVARSPFLGNLMHAVISKYDDQRVSGQFLQQLADRCIYLADLCRFLRRAGSGPDDLLDLMRTLDYRPFVLDATEDRLVPASPGEDASAELVFRPKERS